MAATGASSPVPPGIPRDPGPGQYYASPALAALLRSTPADQLADRYPGHLAGTIGDAALPSPNSLVIIVGRTPAQLAHTPDSVRVTSIADGGARQRRPGDAGEPQGPGLHARPTREVRPSAIDLILSVVALAILAPVLIFIATATRLSAARREQRFAAMRLVGATRKQVSLLAAIESTAAAVLGVAAGFGIFFLLRVPVAGIPFIGEPFFPAELTLSLPDILAVAIGVPRGRRRGGPAGAAPGAHLPARRRPPGDAEAAAAPGGCCRCWPAWPSSASGSCTATRPPIRGQIQAFASGFLLIIVGLFIAGPWLTMAAARVMARWTSRPGTLIAARRLADDPRAAFRAVSGLVLALFITTVAVVAIATQDAKNVTRFGTAAESNMLTDQVAASTSPGDSPARRDGHGGTGRARRAAHRAAARDSRRPGGGRGPRGPGADHSRDIPRPRRQLVGPPARSRRAWSRARSSRPFPPSAAARPGRRRRRSRQAGSTARCSATGPRPAITWPAVNIPAARLDALGVDAINVGTDGSRPAVEQARTVLENAYAYPALNAPSTIGDLDRAGQFHQQRLPAARERGDPGQPADRRLHARRGHRGRARRPQAAVQPAAAHRRPARHAAPRRRAGGRRPAARRRRRRDRHRVRRRRDVRLRGAAATRWWPPAPRTTSSPRAGSWCPSASSRPPSRCWPASPAPRSRETSSCPGSRAVCHTRPRYSRT